MNANPLARLVSSVISAIALFVTPMFPFRRPCAHRLRMRAQYLRENPKPTMESV